MRLICRELFLRCFNQFLSLFSASLSACSQVPNLYRTLRPRAAVMIHPIKPHELFVRISIGLCFCSRTTRLSACSSRFCARHVVMQLSAAQLFRFELVIIPACRYSWPPKGSDFQTGRSGTLQHHHFLEV